MNPSISAANPPRKGKMSAEFVRPTLICVLIPLVFVVREGTASEPLRMSPGGPVVPGRSCSSGVTTKSERSAIVRRWLIIPGFAGAISLASAVLSFDAETSAPHRRPALANGRGVTGWTSGSDVVGGRIIRPAGWQPASVRSHFVVRAVV